ncbi:transglutaminase-like domain-containing protein [Maribacter litopenaei]|uniref:Transglutaminase-like domain-containing protein n=1 Tax=Maribacter litopenaei TaxID=2976127 RepID=A0ABY5YAT1_9FLAO|nr:transglutaminase-like domain-containing protein [Maribacter litopenaei]UWX56156.1 transglutaminase-like domain-containing protein [Maribacter litopenaei]
MWKEYTVTYKSDNVYDNWVHDAYWQFLIIPVENETQKLLEFDFANSIHCINQYSINGFGFDTIKVHPKKKFKQISFEATFKVLKSNESTPNENNFAKIETSLNEINSLNFKIDFERYLRETSLTALPKQNKGIFKFESNTGIFENLLGLNHWSHSHLKYIAGVTNIASTLETILNQRSGVCQDFAHLFCAVCRHNQVPCRYVAGYLNHESGYLGNSQMHAWVEAFVPGSDG